MSEHLIGEDSGCTPSKSVALGEMLVKGHLLKFEAKLREQTEMTYSIVRPTAFFKSVSGQLEVVNSGARHAALGR